MRQIINTTPIQIKKPTTILPATLPRNPQNVWLCQIKPTASGSAITSKINHNSGEEYGNFFMASQRSLTKKAKPPPTRDVNRDSGTASANGGWLRRLVRRMIHSSE